MPPADLYRLVGATTTRPQTSASAWFPPEFRFSPDTGEALVPAPQRDPATWLPPHGTAPVVDVAKQGRELRGLQQTAPGLRLRPAGAAGGPPAATDDAAHTLPLPPPGRYEFCVARFGAQEDLLLAIEPERGGLFAWMPVSQQWLAIESAPAGHLADASVPHDRWRMELRQQDTATTLFLPTKSGLATVKADALSLSCAISYSGDGPALGAPIFWSGEVWAPVRSRSGALSLVSAAGSTVPAAWPVAVESFAPPVCDARQIVWPCEQGQLVVRKGLNGAPEASWVDWPAGVRPRFEFGCPYLSRTGSFWQMGWDEAAESFLFVQLGRPQPEVHAVSSPRLCTGSFSYLHSHRLKGDPWLDPEHAVDANSDDVVVPMIESVRHAAVLGLVLETTAGVTALLESKDRHRVELQYQADNCPDIRFFTMLVTRPWHTRAFVYDERLWIYHPDLPDLDGWDLEP